MLDYCNANGITVSENMSDIGSGLNFNRPEWNQLLQKVEDREVNKIYVTHKDRFVRLAFDWFANFCSAMEVKSWSSITPRPAPAKN